MSRIDVPRAGTSLPAGRNPVAGVAWAPPRGVARVEIQVDEGSWRECALGPSDSAHTWVQWHLEWDATPGDHVLRVRATDGDGVTQTSEVHGPQPDGATGWQRFRFITLPMLSPLIAVVMTFSVLFTFTDFQLIYVLTRGGPLNATHLMATLSFQRAIPGGQLGEGAAIAVAMIPFLLAAILFSYFGLQRRKWQQGGGD